jgi:hypothetical protein
MATAPQPAMPVMPHSVSHLNLSGISNSTLAVPTQAVATSSQTLLEDGLKVTISHSYYLFIISMLIGLKSQSLVKEDLKNWIDQYNVGVKSTNKLRSKEGAFKT